MLYLYVLPSSSLYWSILKQKLIKTNKWAAGCMFGTMFTCVVVYWMCVMWRGSPLSVYCKLQHVVVLGHTVEILETRWLEYGSWGRLPCFPLMPPTPHAWHSGGLLDGTVAHMANHSSRAEVFSKGLGRNLKRDCLHRGQRPSGQERPISCWPLRDRHINSWVVTPLSTHARTHSTINPFHV